MTENMDEEIRYQFTNWEKYQGKTDRKRQWVKLWRYLFTHRVWDLTPPQFKVFITLLLVANADEGSIELDHKQIARRSRVNQKAERSSLAKLNDFGILTSVLSATEDKKTNQQKENNREDRGHTTERVRWIDETH